MSSRCLCTVLAALVISGCASMSNRSSADLVNAELAASKKVVTLSSDKSPEEIQRAIAESSCGGGTQRMSSLAYAGPNTYVPVSSSMTFSVEQGEFGDGRKWSILRGDGVLHMAASGIVVAPADSGSTIQVLKADRSKAGQIKESVEAGTIFCRWREFDYPYD